MAFDGITLSCMTTELNNILKDGRVEKVFYLTPKTTTAEAASDCLNVMAESGAKIRALIITAKEKICREGHACKKSHKLCRRNSCR